MIFVQSTGELEEMSELSMYLGKMTTMAHLADLLFFMGDYSRAISFCQRALREFRDNWHLAVHCYSIMGKAYENQPELALQSFENALEIQLQYNPMDYNGLAAMYNNMGFAHHKLKSNSQVVVNYYETALKMCQSVVDTNSTDWCLMATILNNLVTCRAHDDIDLALEREQLVLEIRLKYLPLSHPLVAITHSTLAEIYSERAEYDEALTHYEEALRIKLKYLPNDHPSIAQIYCDIGLHSLYKGDSEMNTEHYAVARTSYKKSMKASLEAIDFASSTESSLPTNYALLCFCINTCGVIYTRLNRFDDAIKCFDTLINILNQHLSVDHALHIAFFRNRGRIFTLHGDMQRGMEYYEYAIKFCDQINLKNSAEKAQIYLNVAEWYELSNQNDFALEYYQHALQLATRYLSAGHPLFLWCAKGIEKMKSIPTVAVDEISWL